MNYSNIIVNIVITTFIQQRMEYCIDFCAIILDSVHTMPAEFENGTEILTFRGCVHMIPA